MNVKEILDEYASNAIRVEFSDDEIEAINYFWHGRPSKFESISFIDDDCYLAFANIHINDNRELIYFIIQHDVYGSYTNSWGISKFKTIAGRSYLELPIIDFRSR